jgi:histidyl-tRNA synthetase
MDVEVFNEKDPAVDAEIVEMAATLLESVGVTGSEILVNSVGCRACRPGYHRELRKEAEKSRTGLCPDCQRKIDTNPLRIFDCKVESCQEIARDLPKITDFLCEECEDHFARFKGHLDLYALPYTVEPLLVRGLDYYTKTTFEFTSTELGAQDAVLGGGRYDDMMRDFGGPDICGIGFALGMERLLLLVPDQETADPFVYVVWMGEEARRAGMTAARTLRRQGFEVWIEYKDRSFKNQLSRANKLGAAWSLIIGDDETSKGTFQLKDMASGEQQEKTLEELPSTLRNSD